MDDITEGLIALLEEVSHDPEKQDFFDVREYIENLPNPYHTLWEVVQWVHKDYL